MIRPPCRTAIRSARCSASSRCCVVSSTVVPPSASSRTVLQTSLRDCGSSPVVGSSRKSTGGSPMRLIAMSRRRRMPPEYVAARRSPASSRSKRASSPSAIPRGSGRRRSRATSTRFSRPVRTSSTAANCPVRLIDPRTSAAWLATSYPWTVAVPPSACSSVDRIRTMVVLPAPLEPSRARTVPGGTLRSTPRSTVVSPKDRVRPVISMAGVVDMGPASSPDAASGSSPIPGPVDGLSARGRPGPAGSARWSAPPPP